MENGILEPETLLSSDSLERGKKRVPILAGNPSWYREVLEEELEKEGFSKEGPLYRKVDDECVFEVREVFQSERTERSKAMRRLLPEEERELPYVREVVEELNEDDAVEEIFFVGKASALVYDRWEQLFPFQVVAPDGLAMLEDGEATGFKEIKNGAFELESVKVRGAALSSETPLLVGMEEARAYWLDGFATLDRSSYGLSYAKKPIYVAQVILNILSDGERAEEMLESSRKRAVGKQVCGVVRKYMELGKGLF